MSARLIDMSHIGTWRTLHLPTVAGGAFRERHPRPPATLACPWTRVASIAAHQARVACDICRDYGRQSALLSRQQHFPRIIAKSVGVLRWPGNRPTVRADASLCGRSRRGVIPGGGLISKTGVVATLPLSRCGPRRRHVYDILYEAAWCATVLTILLSGDGLRKSPRDCSARRSRRT